jgi:hypothetical protein
MLTSITYKDSHGKEIVFLKNTTFTANVKIGDSSSPDSEDIAYMAQLGNSNITLVTQPNGFIEYYASVTTSHNDYGFSYWAEDTLAPSEFTVFTGQAAVWSNNISSGKKAIDDPNFNYWWSRFMRDPNVAITES